MHPHLSPPQEWHKHLTNNIIMMKRCLRLPLCPINLSKCTRHRDTINNTTSSLSKWRSQASGILLQCMIRCYRSSLMRPIPKQAITMPWVPNSVGIHIRWRLAFYVINSESHSHDPQLHIISRIRSTSTYLSNVYVQYNNVWRIVCQSTCRSMDWLVSSAHSFLFPKETRSLQVL